MQRQEFLILGSFEVGEIRPVHDQVFRRTVQSSNPDSIANPVFSAAISCIFAACKSLLRRLRFCFR